MSALVFAIATAIALGLTHVAVSALRRLTGPDVHLAAFVIVVAGIVAALELAMRGWLPAVHADVGRYVPLIAALCLVVRRAPETPR